ncbi:phage capsid protein [Streptococcus marmotae]|uniref:phage capsid protein n=1 Tax=Streptococcus marmotae TaxID=1825069 RepID=UPI00082A40AD|nr:phage capsid protein [Streptococcus marmotae]QBX16920.1 major capsid protein [Streptococcus phage Javan291]
MSGTQNQNLPVRQYAPQYRQILSTVFDAKKAFEGVLAPIQALDGVQFNAKAFSVKTNVTPVVVGTYSTDANTAFGTGTGNSTRFGQMTEVIYADTDVEYSYTLSIHEGIDRYTVNNDLNAAIADRLKLQSEAQTRQMNKRIGKFLSDNAGETKALADFSEDKIKKLFNDINAYVINTEITAPIKAYVRAELYNAIVDMASVTTAKGASVSIDTNGLVKYKNVTLIETPAQYFAEGVLAIFAPDGIVIPFVGIQTARTIEAQEFDGVKFQAAAKGGTFILDDNKKALIKVTGTIV